MFVDDDKSPDGKFEDISIKKADLQGDRSPLVLKFIKTKGDETDSANADDRPDDEDAVAE